MRRLIEVAVFTPNVDRVTRFYEALLTACASRGVSDAHFQLGDIHLLIHPRYEPDPDYPPGEDHIAFGVGDLDHAYRDLVAQGLKFQFPPRSYDWGRSAYLADPDGRLVELAEVKIPDAPR